MINWLRGWNPDNNKLPPVGKRCQLLPEAMRLITNAMVAGKRYIWHTYLCTPTKVNPANHSALRLGLSGWVDEKFFFFSLLGEDPPLISSQCIHTWWPGWKQPVIKQVGDRKIRACPKYWTYDMSNYSAIINGRKSNRMGMIFISFAIINTGCLVSFTIFWN